MKHVDEAVDTILARGHPDWPLVRQAITTAVEVEREACAALCEGPVGTAPDTVHPQDVVTAETALRFMAGEIRARGEGVKRG